MDLLEIDKKLQNEYANSRINAENQALINKNKANANPVYKKLDELERDLVFLIGKEEAKEKPNKKSLLDCNNELKTIESNKLKILNSLGLSKADLKPKYSCEKCKDTGLVGGYVCDCYKKRRNAEIIKSYGLSNDKFVSFNDVNESLFTDKKQLQDFTKLKDILKNWCENYPDNITKYNIYICGTTGIGKTFLLRCITKTMLEKGFQVFFISACKLNDTFLEYVSKPYNQKQQILSPLLDCDILIIDDLGSEPFIRNITDNFLFTIISERERFNRPTIISSNFGIDHVQEVYGERLYSRLTNKFTSKIFNLEGLDLRRK